MHEWIINEVKNVFLQISKKFKYFNRFTENFKIILAYLAWIFSHIKFKVMRKLIYIMEDDKSAQQSCFYIRLVFLSRIYNYFEESWQLISHKVEWGCLRWWQAFIYFKGWWHLNRYSSIIGIELGTPRHHNFICWAGLVDNPNKREKETFLWLSYVVIKFYFVSIWALKILRVRC